jgi:hypothetical protein
MMLTAAAADIEFVFSGQPECVQVDYEAGITHVQNDCAAPILLDSSVKQAWQPLAPGKAADVRDLSAFTIGLDGVLYRAVAMIVPSAADESSSGPRLQQPSDGQQVTASP